jgi:hypothetical protein
MASLADQATALNFTSNIETDRVIYAKSVNVIWLAAVSAVYTFDTGLGDYCLPLATYSLDGNKWYEQGLFDETNTYLFGIPQVDDTGVITILQGAPASGISQNLYIRVMCLAHPAQKAFGTIYDGRPQSYASNYRYLKIAQSGTIQAVSNGATETAVNQTIPHNLGYVPQIRTWVRYNNGTKNLTRQLSNGAKPQIKVDSTNLYFNTDTTLSGTNFIVAPGPLYFYYIYYDNI